MTDAIAIASAGPVDALAAEGGAWMRLIPAGEFSSPRDGRKWSSGDRARLERIVAATRKIAGSTELVVDYDHQTEFASVQGVGGRAPAAGWIKTLEVRDDGIWGRVEWTAPAAEAVRSREYRYLSPTFYHDRSGRVLALKSAALTNTPAIDDLVAAAASTFTNRPAIEVLVAMAKAEPFMNDNDPIATLRTRLGLSGSMTEAELKDFVAELGALLPGAARALGVDISTTSAQPDPTRFVPIAVFEAAVGEMNKLRQGMTQAAATAHVEDHVRSGKIAPFLKDWAVALCTSNKPAFDEFVGRVGPAFKVLTEPQLTATARAVPGSPLSETEAAVCSALGLTEAEFKSSARPAGR